MLKLTALRQGSYALLISCALLLSACGQSVENETDNSNNKNQDTPSSGTTNETGSKSAGVEHITIDNAVIRAMPPGMNISAAFMTLSNSSDQPIELQSATTPLAKVVELHETRMQGDVMSMQKVDNITVPANGSVKLEPGGFHVMLLDVQGTLEVDDKHPMTLTFSDGSTTDITATIVMIGQAHENHSKN